MAAGEIAGRGAELAVLEDEAAFAQPVAERTDQADAFLDPLVGFLVFAPAREHGGETLQPL